MKEKLYTIPLNDAVSADDECALCNVERHLEQDAIDFTLGAGASYMESDIREMTDKMGFCRHHLKMMHDYGNALGNALILKTHVRRVRAELKKAMDSYSPSGKKGIFAKSSGESTDSVSEFLKEEEDKCFVCDYYRDTYERYIDTFFYLYKNDSEFVTKIKNGKGFCLHHLKDLLEGANKRLNKNEAEEFAKLLNEVMTRNLARIDDDISWFVDKFDYRNRDADWKNSKDAIPRTMQKLAGGYPADGPYKESK